jgi:hypothetical protein
LNEKQASRETDLDNLPRNTRDRAVVKDDSLSMMAHNVKICQRERHQKNKQPITKKVRAIGG